MTLYKILFTGTLVRLCYHLSLQLLFPEVKQYNALKAVLFDPVYSLTQFRESCYLSRLFLDGRLSLPMQNKMGTKPVFLLAFTERVLFERAGESMDGLFILLSIMIDLLIAVQLFRLARNVTRINHVDKQWESEFEQQMNPSIHPTHAWIFGLDFGAHFHKDDKGINDEHKRSDESKSNENGIKAEAKLKLSKADKTPLFEIADVPVWCCIFYYLNPISILTSSTDPTFQGVQYLLLISTFHQITRDSQNKDQKLMQQFKAAFYLALLTYIDIYYIIYISPLMCCIRQNQYPKIKLEIATCTFFFIFSSMMINTVSLVMSTKSDTISIPGILYVGRDPSLLSPNIGLHWYLFMNLFERCKHFFIVVTKVIPFLLFIPLSIRFYRYPIALVAMCQSLSSLLKQTPTLQDLSFALVLMLMEPRTLSRMSSYSIIAILAIPVTIVLFIVDYWLWLESGVGNPNYLFFQCLAYSIFFMTLIFQFMSSTMKRDKALRLTEKACKSMKKEQ